MLSLIQALLALLQACAPILALIGIGLWGQSQKGAGAQLQGAQDTAAVDQVTVKAEMAIAVAEAAAPTTRLALVDRLKQGTF